MEYRRFGTSHLETPVIGLGCWGLGGEPYGPVKKETAVRAMNSAIDLGITLIDGAPYYGHTEEWFGEELAHRRQEVVLVTKCNYRLGPQDHQNVLSSIEGSLANLCTDYVDLYLLVIPEPDPLLEESVRALAEVQQSGKARYVGVLGWQADVLRRASEWAPLVANQVGYNLFDRRWQQNVFSTCEELGIGIQAFAPLSSGVLSGNHSRDTVFDLRYQRPNPLMEVLNNDNRAKNLAVVAQLQSFASARGVTIAQLALAWVLADKRVSVALIGTRRPDRMVEDLGALNIRLTPNDLTEIDSIMDDAETITAELG